MIIVRHTSGPTTGDNSVASYIRGHLSKLDGDFVVEVVDQDWWDLLNANWKILANLIKAYVELEDHPETIMACHRQHLNKTDMEDFFRACRNKMPEKVVADHQKALKILEDLL